MDYQQLFSDLPENVFAWVNVIMKVCTAKQIINSDESGLGNISLKREWGISDHTADRRSAP